jgi:hypothetical protein
MPDDAADIPHPGDSEADGLDSSGDLADFRHVPDAVLVFQHHEDARQEVLDHVLRAESDRYAQHSRARSRARARG